jgi:hypothetical protein
MIKLNLSAIGLRVTFPGEFPASGADKMPTNQDLILLLLRQTGDSFHFGVELDLADPDPTVFDCSEFVEWGCTQLKLTPAMPDGCWVQANHCHRHGLVIPVERALWTVGALLFVFSSDPFEAESPRDVHVAVSLGNGMTIEARSKKRGVGVFTATDRGWTHAALIPGLEYPA